MTDSITIPSSSSASHVRQAETEKSSGANVAPSTPPVATDPSETPSSLYSSSVSCSESSPASPFPALEALSISRTHSSSNTSEAALSKGSEHRRKLSAREKGKMPARSREMQLESRGSSYSSNDFERRTSLLSSSLSKSEHTVVNVGEPDRPRLITCVKTSQGFDWNQEIFLPSYISQRDFTTDLERRQDPVEDIFITDEEAEMMFPR